MLTEDLALVINQGAGVIVALPDDQIFIVDRVVGHGRRVAKSSGRIVGITIRPHITDAKVAPDFRAGGPIETLAIDDEICQRFLKVL